MDVARKVIILGRVAGLDLTQETVQVENIVPELLRNASPEEFMAKLPDFDAHFEKLNQEAIQNGQVLRYVGLVDPVHGKSSVTLARLANPPSTLFLRYGEKKNQLPFDAMSHGFEH